MPTSPAFHRRTTIESPSQRKALEATNTFQSLRENIKAGKAPTNDQIDFFLGRHKETLHGGKDLMSGEGRKIIEDSERVVDSLRRFLEIKNRNEDIQRMGENLSRALKNTDTNYLKPSKEERLILKEAAGDLKNVLRVMIGSKNYRKAVINFTMVFKDLQRETKNESEKEKVIEEFKDRLVDLLDETSRTVALRDFTTRLLNLNDLFYNHFVRQMEMQKRRSSSEIGNFLFHLRSFLGEFTTEENISNIESSIRYSRLLVDEDKNFKNLLTNWRQFFENSVSKSEFVGKQQIRKELDMLTTRTREFLTTQKSAEPIQRLMKNLRTLMENIDKDPERIQLTRDTQRLLRDFFMDRRGDICINQEAIHQIRTIFIPYVIEQMQYFALPPIESNEKGMYVLAQNIVLKTRDVIPDKIAMHIESDSQINTRQYQLENPYSTMRFTLRDFEVHAQRANIYINKTSFPKLTDDMILDFGVTGTRNQIIAEIISTVRSELYTGKNVVHFDVGNVNVKLDKIKIHVREGQHKKGVSFGTSLMKRSIKKSIAASMKKQIEDYLYQLVDALNNTGLKVRQINERLKFEVQRQTREVINDINRERRRYKEEKKKKLEGLKDETEGRKEEQSAERGGKDEVEEEEEPLERKKRTPQYGIAASRGYDTSEGRYGREQAEGMGQEGRTKSQSVRPEESGLGYEEEGITQRKGDVNRRGAISGEREPRRGQSTLGYGRQDEGQYGMEEEEEEESSEDYEEEIPQEPEREGKRRYLGKEEEKKQESPFFKKKEGGGIGYGQGFSDDQFGKSREKPQMTGVKQGYPKNIPPQKGFNEELSEKARKMQTSRDVAA